MTEGPPNHPAHQQAPPGYCIATAAARRTQEARLARQLLGFGMLLTGTIVGLWYELGLHQPRAYLEPGQGLSWWTALGAALAGAAVGGSVAARLRRPGTSLPWLLLVAALSAGASGFIWFYAFTHPWAFDAAAVGVPLIGCGLATLALVAAGRALWFRAVAIGVFELAIDPGIAIVATVALGAAAGALTVVGFLRAGALLGMTLTTLALWATTLVGAAQRQPLRRARWIRGTALIVFVAGLLAFSHAGRLVTVDDLSRYDGAVVHTFTSPRGRYVTTSGQASFALFVDGKLELSTLDGYRYAEALVHPVLAIAPRRARVAILGGGKGLLEREVLRYDDVEQVDVIVPDAALPRLARTAPWVDQTARSVLRTGRLAIVVEEPLVWLDANGPQYDVVIVDVPDPTSYGEAKNYTQYFYSRLRARIGTHGVAAAQATSPFRSPDTFHAIVATARAANLGVLPYRAPLPTFGEWGFVLLARTTPVAPRAIREDLAFLDGPTMLAMFATPTDTQSTSNVVPNRLNDMTLLETFERELTRQ